MKLLSTIILFVCCLLHLPAQNLVRDIYPGTTSAGINDMIVYGSELALMAGDNLDGVELWKSNGTFGGTVQVKDIYLGSGNAYPAGFEIMNGWLYFRADHPSYGFEVWKSDLTTGNTTLLKDTDPGSDDGVYTSIDFEIVASNNNLYIPLNDGVYGRELWVSDGTTAGTVRLLDTYVGTIGTVPGAGDPKQMTPFGNGILFSTYDYDLNLGTGLGRELWRSNGTVGTTAMIKDIHPGAGSSNPDNFLVVGPFAFFSADDGTNGDELWRTNGTPGGTVLLKDINLNALTGSDPSNLVQVGSDIFFFADDGTHGKELWKTDGTAAGTVLVKDINTGSADSYVNPVGKGKNAISYNGKLYFASQDGSTGINGGELWVSDGTSAGTYLLKDVYPGVASSYLNYFEVIDNTLFFYANDGTNGYELWASNGTVNGTLMIADLNAGASSGSPTNFKQIGTNMYFTANNGATGQELFSFDLTTLSLPLPVELLDFAATLQEDQTVALNWITGQELNHDYFEVERKSATGHFESLYRLEGQGSSFNQSHYQATDFQPMVGNNLYRLKQVDLDGSVHYSHLVNVFVGKQGLRLLAFPNPCRDRVRVEVSGCDHPQSLELRNLQGQIFLKNSYLPGSLLWNWI